MTLLDQFLFIEFSKYEINFIASASGYVITIDYTEKMPKIKFQNILNESKHKN